MGFLALRTRQRQIKSGIWIVDRNMGNVRILKMQKV